MVHPLWSYANDSLRYPEESKEALKELVEWTKEADVVLVAGEGRSGYVGRMGATMIKDASSYWKDVYFMTDSNFPSRKRLEGKEVLTIPVSSSGRTSDIIRFVKEIKEVSNNGKVASFTSFKGGDPTPLEDISDLIVLTPLGREDKAKVEKRGGSYGSWKLVSESDPTMGDIAEELALIGLYSVASGVAGEYKAPDTVPEYLKEWIMTDSNMEGYHYLTETMKNSSGVLLFARGTSDNIAGMIANRGRHYGTRIRAVSEATSPRLDPNMDLIVLSNSANPLYGEDIKGLKKRKELSRRVGPETYRSPTFTAVVGREADWLKECQNYIVIGNGVEQPYTFVRSDEITVPDVFRPVVPIILNAALRGVAHEYGITEELAKGRHRNI